MVHNMPFEGLMINLLMEQLGFSTMPLGGFLEVLPSDQPDDIYAACLVALRRTWDRPPQPADLLRIIDEGQAYLSAIASRQEAITEGHS
jgi:hypothetical protein